MIPQVSLEKVVSNLSDSNSPACFNSIYSGHTDATPQEGAFPQPRFSITALSCHIENRPLLYPPIPRGMKWFAAYLELQSNSFVSWTGPRLRRLEVRLCNRNDGEGLTSHVTSTCGSFPIMPGHENLEGTPCRGRALPAAPGISEKALSWQALWGEEHTQTHTHTPFLSRKGNVVKLNGSRGVSGGSEKYACCSQPTLHFCCHHLIRTALHMIWLVFKNLTAQKGAKPPKGMCLGRWEKSSTAE